MTANAATATRPWAFWAPSHDQNIASALDLAGVGPGTKFLDLGCGDGRVLVAAAKLGAEVRGVELDERLVDQARASLAAAGLPGTVDLADMFSASLEADVIYAYLTPVVLSHLRARLAQGRSGTRIVTPRYRIAGCRAAAFESDCYLYETPLSERTTRQLPGWPWRATLLALPADRRVLVPLTLTAGCWPVAVELDAVLAPSTNHAVGAPPFQSSGQVPVDLIFEPHGAGSVIAGSIRAGDAELTVAAVFSKAGRGQWTYTADEGELFHDALDKAIAITRAPGQPEAAPQ